MKSAECHNHLHLFLLYLSLKTKELYLAETIMGLKGVIGENSAILFMH